MARMDEVTVTAPKRPESVWAPVRSSDFEVFFEQHHERLSRALWRLTRNRQEAEEVMQDAFLRLWERWDKVIVDASVAKPEGEEWLVPPTADGAS
jgi:predicted RNA polymerase sigma factor